MLRGPRLLTAALFAAGAALIAAAWLAPGSSPLGYGFGRRRTLAAALGIFLTVLAWPAARARVAALWTAVPPLRPGECIATAVWFGLITGFFEVLHQGCRKYLAGTMIRHTEHILWMAPLSHLLVFSVVGAALAVLAAIAPKLVQRVFVCAVLGSLAAWSQLLMHGVLSRIAVLALAIGLGFAMARALAAHWGVVATLRRRSTPALLLLLVAMAAGVPAWKAWGESRALADLPQPPAGAPNVLLVVLDTVRADRLSAYGHERETSPQIDALAEDGVLFQWPVSTSPWTLPAHVTLFTGRYDSEDPADWVSVMAEDPPTLAELLSARGWSTGGFVGNLSYCSHVYGLDRGFARYVDYFVDPWSIAWHTGLGRKILPDAVHGIRVRNSAKTVTDAFLDWLPTTGERPFFAFLNYFDAHALYVPEGEYATAFGPLSPHLDRWYQQRSWNDEELQGFLDAYDALILTIDDQIARIVERLRADARLANTLIVVTGDHGEQWGENGIYEHGNSLYWSSLHVPMIVSWPGRVPPKRLDQPVSIRDLPATILELAGVEQPAEFPGHSLAPLWEGGGVATALDTPLLSEITRTINMPRHLPASKGDMRSLVEGSYHYILTVGENERQELYNYVKDPREETNLVDDPAHADRVASMRAALDRSP